MAEDQVDDLGPHSTSRTALRGGGDEVVHGGGITFVQPAPAVVASLNLAQGF